VSAISLVVSACGSGGDTGGAGSSDMSLSAGPDVCFNAVADQIGSDAKVSEITSMFSAGPDVDSSASEPAGTMTVCTAYYQNPDDPRKLLSISYVPALGEFTDPADVEVSVSGDAADFNLEDYLVPLSEVKAGALSAVFDANEAQLADKYSAYAWTGVQLADPGTFNDEFALRIAYEGRLKSNDVKDDGYAMVALDGTTVTDNNLFD
tara:strand:+ start:33234 stop:33854 length:621 start_codon:yes stop_codon:yes gene_type:complete